MAEVEMHSVLRCGQCNKPFDKESTLKRHGYYCRSRKVGGAVRSRSCVCCARRKARCDNKRPRCSRCAARSIECHYPSNKPEDTIHGQGRKDDAVRERQQVTPQLVADSSIIEHPETNNGFVVTSNDMLWVAESDFVGGASNYLDLSGPTVGVSDFVDQASNDPNTLYYNSELSSLTPNTALLDDSMFRTEDISISPDFFIPPLPSHSPRSLIHRGSMVAGAQRISHLMFHTLKSYPMMMLRRNTFPPYIHPHMMSSNDENDDMEPLNNCINLIHMLNQGIRGSQKLFWRNVRQECERLCEIHMELNKWELLAAMQALSIYIIIRLDQGETEHNNFDFLLTATVTAVAKRSNDINNHGQHEPDNYGKVMSWKDWIFQESSRRLCVVYQILNLLVYFEPAALCDMQSDLILAPLPAEQHLWEASDELVWKLEREEELGLRPDFGLTANGDLVKLGGGQPYCKKIPVDESLDASAVSKVPAEWDEWCSGMDKFGGLVMLAASLIGH